MNWQYFTLPVLLKNSLKFNLITILETILITSVINLPSSKSEVKEAPDQNLPDICEVDEMDTGKENYIWYIQQCLMLHCIIYNKKDESKPAYHTLR